jgi:hypothetical protein
MAVRDPAARVVPLACDQPTVPGKQRRRGHREHLALPAAGDQPRQCCEPQPVARLVADPADLAAQYGVLVPEHQELGILGHLTPRQHHEAVEQTAHEQVDAREHHSGMISPRKTPSATPDRVAERSALLRERAGHHPNRISEPHRTVLLRVSGPGTVPRRGRLESANCGVEEARERG